VKLQFRPTFAQFSRFAWLGSFALLGFTLIRLAPSPGLASRFASLDLLPDDYQFAQPSQYYRLQVLSARQLSFAIFLRSLALIGKFPLLICFVPFDPCPALGNFFKLILVIFVGRNTSTVATTYAATRNHQQ